MGRNYLYISITRTKTCETQGKFLSTRNMVPGETAKNDHFSLNEID